MLKKIDEENHAKATVAANTSSKQIGEGRNVKFGSLLCHNQICPTPMWHVFFTNFYSICSMPVIKCEA